MQCILLCTASHNHKRWKKVLEDANLSLKYEFKSQLGLNCFLISVSMNIYVSELSF